MFDTYTAYDEYKQIVESGDTSSPKYWSAREFYEDTLRMWDCFRNSWQLRAEFAASMLPPYNYTVLEFKKAHEA